MFICNVKASAFASREEQAPCNFSTSDYLRFLTLCLFLCVTAKSNTKLCLVDHWKFDCF